MRPGPRRAWSLLALAMLVVALGAVAAGGPPHLAGRYGTGLSSGSAPTGALDAVLRTEADRVESALGGTSASASRLIVLLAAPLIGVGLLLLLAPAGRAVAPGDLPSLTRLRRWVGLRAPPSVQLVVLTH